MPQPDFTTEEKYLLNGLKSSHVGTNPQMWGYLIGTGLLVCFGMIYASLPMVFTAFVAVCGFRIYEELFQHKYTPVWCSIIRKFETEVSRADGTLNVTETDQPAES